MHRIDDLMFGLYVASFSTHVKLGQSIRPRSRLRSHLANGARTLTFLPLDEHCYRCDLEDVERAALRIAEGRGTRVRHGDRYVERFVDLTHDQVVEAAQDAVTALYGSPAPAVQPDMPALRARIIRVYEHDLTPIGKAG